MVIIIIFVFDLCSLLYYKFTTGRWVYLIIGEITANLTELIMYFAVTAFITPFICLVIGYKLCSWFSSMFAHMYTYIIRSDDRNRLLALRSCLGLVATPDRRSSLRDRDRRCKSLTQFRAAVLFRSCRYCFSRENSI